jgi:hypothetical protein
MMLPGETIDGTSPLIDLGDTVPLNRIDENGVWWVCTEVTGWGGPASTSQATERYGADGAWQTQGFRSSREIGVSGIVIAPSQAAAVLAADKLKLAVKIDDFQFTVDEHGLQRYVRARRSGEIDIDQLSTRFTFSFSVTAGDPLKYSVDEKDVSSRLLLITGGLVVPAAGLTVPAAGLHIPATVIQDDALAINGGNVVAYPRIRIDGTVANPIITNDSTGEQMLISMTVGAGDYLEIDTFRKSVKLNGVTDRIAYVKGDWLTMKVGDNLFRYQGNTYHSDSEMTIYWRDRWE